MTLNCRSFILNAKYYIEFYLLSLWYLLRESFRVNIRFICNFNILRHARQSSLYNSPSPYSVPHHQIFILLLDNYFLIPALISITLFIIYPLILSISLSTVSAKTSLCSSQLKNKIDLLVHITDFYFLS